MEFPVFHGGRAVGGVTAEKDGLYAVLRADCACFAPGVQRLWGVDGLRVQCLGVLSPEEGRLRLLRRLSLRALPELPGSFLAGRGEGGWLPWRGKLAGEQIEAGWIREDQSALAMPFSEALPAAVYEHATELSPVTVCRTLCLRIAASAYASNSSRTGQ